MFQEMQTVSAKIFLEYLPTTNGFQLQHVSSNANI
jgi:hypothetical protein